MTSQILVEVENVGLNILRFGVVDWIQAMNVGKSHYAD